MNSKEFISKEIAGLQTFLSKYDPLPKCKDGKRHKWYFDAWTQSKAKADRGKCSKCGLRWRHVSRITPDKRNWYEARIKRLSSFLESSEEVVSCQN